MCIILLCCVFVVGFVLSMLGMDLPTVGSEVWDMARRAVWAAGILTAAIGAVMWVCYRILDDMQSDGG